MQPDLNASAEAYWNRFRNVLAHIETHLEEDLSVERLSGVAAFSKSHFHRQFSELFGIGVYQYLKLVRLKRAGYELAFRDHHRILDVALASGYESHEAFSRAFRKAIGQPPSEFRDQPEWEAWHATYSPLGKMRSLHMKPNHRLEDVKVALFPETRVAVLEHRGDPKRIGDTIRKFIEWRKENKLPPKVSATFNLLYGGPEDTPPEEFRLDLCAAATRGVAANEFGVVEKVIPGGRCAVLRHMGSDDLIGVSIAFLYATWLPQSGEEPRDFPLTLQRVAFFPDVAESEAVTDVFLPLR
jgi:AraC family transcriptional regulator